MSTVTPSTLRIHWSDDALDALETNESWFREFDDLLRDLEVEPPLPVRQDADTWYFINDIDVTFPTDCSPGEGLDTWDF